MESISPQSLGGKIISFPVLLAVLLARGMFVPLRAFWVDSDVWWHIKVIAVLLILGSPRYPVGSPWRTARTAAIAALYVIPLCLLIFHAAPMFLLAPVLIALAMAAMAGSASLSESEEPALVPANEN